MDRSPLHSFITSRSCVPAGHKSGGMKLEQPRPLQVGPKRKNEPEEVSWRGDGRWNFGDDSVQLGLEWMRGIPTKQISGWDIFRMDIFIVCLSLSIGMSNLHKFTWSTSDSLHPDVFAMGLWRLWQDSEAEEGEQADPDSEEWEISLLWASSFQSTVGLVISVEDICIWKTFQKIHEFPRNRNVSCKRRCDHSCGISTLPGSQVASASSGSAAL